MLKLWDKLKKLREVIQKLREFFAGQKTYITAIAIAVFAVLQYFGYDIDPWIWELLGALGLGFLRAAWKKLEP